LISLTNFDFPHQRFLDLDRSSEAGRRQNRTDSPVVGQITWSQGRGLAYDDASFPANGDLALKPVTDTLVRRHRNDRSCWVRSGHFPDVCGTFSAAFFLKQRCAKCTLIVRWRNRKNSPSFRLCGALRRQ
jgi:hypothetical protein